MSKNKIKQEIYPWTNPKIYELKDGFRGSTQYLNGVDQGIEALLEARILPSRYQIGDLVCIKFSDIFSIKKAEVIKVHFSESKVLYDLEVEFLPGEGGVADTAYTRVYNVDSAIVSPYEQPVKPQEVNEEK